MDIRYLRLKTQFITSEIVVLKISAVLAILFLVGFFVLGNTLSQQLTDDTVTFIEATSYGLRTFASFVILGTVINTVSTVFKLFRSKES